MNTLYPIFLKLRGKPVLVVGGGHVAGQKIRGLLASEASVTVVAPDVSDPISDLAGAGRITLHRRSFEEGDVNGFFLVIGATDDPSLQDRILRDAQRHNAPVNIVDMPDRCTFYLASVFEKGDLKIAVSTNGKSPTLGKIIRDEIGQIFGDGYPELLDFLGGIRNEILTRHADYNERKRNFECIVRNRLKHLKKGRALSGLGPISSPASLEREKSGKVYLVGAGPGDPELITVKGLHCLQTADVVVYDALVSRELLHHVPPAAECVFAGKREGNHSRKQEEINRLLINRAQEGNVVVRLKGGDPFVFGRGGEEFDALRQAGIDVEVVPGITAGTGVPASIGIPLTLRHVSSSVVFVTGHECIGKGTTVDWESVAAIDTIVIYMGIQHLADIALRLQQAGRRSDTPVAVIFAGTWPEELVLDGTLGTIREHVAPYSSDAPGLILVGEVVRFLKHRSEFQLTAATPEADQETP